MQTVGYQGSGTILYGLEIQYHYLCYLFDTVFLVIFIKGANNFGGDYAYWTLLNACCHLECVGAIVSREGRSAGLHVLWHVAQLCNCYRDYGKKCKCIRFCPPQLCKGNRKSTITHEQTVIASEPAKCLLPIIQCFRR